MDEVLLADPAPASGEGLPTTDQLLTQIRDEIHALPERLAATLHPASTQAGPPEVDGR